MGDWIANKNVAVERQKVRTGTEASNGNIFRTIVLWSLGSERVRIGTEIFGETTKLIHLTPSTALSMHDIRA
jgi:hypothetical protein